MIYTVQIQLRECRKLLRNIHSPLYFLAEAIPAFFYIKCYHCANNHRKYADGFNTSMIDDKDVDIPSPLIMFTCIKLRHAHLEWEKNKRIRPKASKSKLKSDRPDRLNYLNYKNDDCKIASCRAAMCRKLITAHGITVTYTILMNTWNTLPVSYQQRVYNNTLATVKHQIQLGKNPTPGAVISTEATRGDIAILLHSLTSEVGLEEPELGRTDPNIPNDNNGTHDELHFVMSEGWDGYDDEDEKFT